MAEVCLCEEDFAGWTGQRSEHPLKFEFPPATDPRNLGHWFPDARAVPPG